MYDFTYHRPTRLEEAVALVAGNDDAKFLAGGMSLIPVLKQRLGRLTDLVDLAGVPGLAGIRREDATLVIGALTRHAHVAASPDVRRAIPALATLADGIGDPLVRNRGTIGGSIANADPAADYPSAVLALNATIETNLRRIAADEFFTGLFKTALEPGEIITAVRFPIARRSAYLKLPHPASRLALVGVFVAQTERNARVAVTGAAPAVFRFKAAEQALGQSFDPSALTGVTMAPDGLNSDIHASAIYRAHAVDVMTRRAVAAVYSVSL